MKEPPPPDHVVRCSFGDSRGRRPGQDPSVLGSLFCRTRIYFISKHNRDIYERTPAVGPCCQVQWVKLLYRDLLCKRNTGKYEKAKYLLYSLSFSLDHTNIYAHISAIFVVGAPGESLLCRAVYSILFVSMLFYLL